MNNLILKDIAIFSIFFAYGSLFGVFITPILCSIIFGTGLGISSLQFSHSGFINKPAFRGVAIGFVLITLGIITISLIETYLKTFIATKI